MAKKRKPAVKPPAPDWYDTVRVARERREGRKAVKQLPRPNMRDINDHI